MTYFQIQQVLVPHQVYIADNAELRCTFESDIDFLREAVSQSPIAKLSADAFVNSENLQNYDIKNIQIQSVGANRYTLVVSFVSWRTGKLQFPEYDLGKALNIKSGEYFIKFSPVDIVSITQTESITTLRDIKTPLLLPGTTYKMYGFLIVLLLVVIVTIRLIIKRNKVSLYIKNKVLLWKYNKNKKYTFRQLYKLRDNRIKDNECATEIQKIMRNYLEFRFDYPFTRTVSSEVMKGFYRATSNLIEGKKEEACEDITAIFIRTDFIRYSKDSFFEQGEREQIISRLLNDVDAIEKQEVSTNA